MEWRGPFGGSFKSDPPTTWPVSMHTPRPHKCPVCVGTGTVPAGFYTQGQATGTNAERCRACGGRGIVIA